MGCTNIQTHEGATTSTRPCLPCPRPKYLHIILVLNTHVAPADRSKPQHALAAAAIGGQPPAVGWAVQRLRCRLLLLSGRLHDCQAH